MLLGVLITIGYVLSTTQSSNNSKKVTEYTLNEEGLIFTYRSGPDGFFLEERLVDLNDASGLQREIILTPTTDYEDQKTRVAGEGSPSWRLAVYKNNMKQSPSVWVDTYPLASNIQLMMGEMQDVTIAGANAVEYTTDGLYRTDNVVIAHGGLMFVASSSYLDDTSLTRKNFDSWIDSFNFVQTEKQLPQGKINVDVACRSALTYTTFINNEDAEKFITECINGEHSDVIERYIKDLDVDGAVI